MYENQEMFSLTFLGSLCVLREACDAMCCHIDPSFSPPLQACWDSESRRRNRENRECYKFKGFRVSAKLVLISDALFNDLALAFLHFQKKILKGYLLSPKY